MRNIQLFLTFLIAFAALPVFADAPKLRLDATQDRVLVTVEATEPSAKLTLVRCLPNEYYPTTPFLTRFDGVGDDCKDDGYEQDRAYYRPSETRAFVEATDVGAGTFELERFSSFDFDRGRDKIFDRFYLIENAEQDATTGFARNGSIVAGPTRVASFPSANDEPREESRSIKGLEAFDLKDAKELGVSHAALTIDLCWLIQTQDVPTVEFPYDGKSFYFNKNAVDRYDAYAREATDLGMQVTFVLVFWGHRRQLAPEGAIFPDFEVWLDAPWTLSIAAPNTTTFEGVERLQALFEFLGERYGRKDKKYGRVSNYVVGNELNSSYIWNNMGKLPLDESVRQYERELRIAFTALRKHWSGANVLAPFDNYWNSNSAQEFQQFHYVDKGGFTAKEYLLALAKLTRDEGDYPWNVAFHPYGLDLRTPIYWDRYSVEQAPRDENAPRITPYNVEILPRFLAKEEMRYKDRPRDFYFTEQGFASPHDDDYVNYNDATYDPNALPEVWLERQAAAYAYAYYKFEAIGAKANIFHRQFDVRSERLNIGLWARPQDAEAGQAVRKPIWELFQKIDQHDSKEYSKKYLKYLIFYPNETAPQSWNELLPLLHDR